MSGPQPWSRPPAGKVGLPGRSVLLGIARLARGRGDGIEQFGNSVSHFTSSLAPLIAMPLVAIGLAMVQQPEAALVANLLAFWCALLARLVVSYELARWWRRDGLWLRYATAFNWCLWILPVAALTLVTVMSIAAGLGMPDSSAAITAAGALMAYALWLHWFLARRGLALGRWRALVLVVLVDLATSLLVALPILLMSLLGG
jgi:hypothetical protein